MHSNGFRHTSTVFESFQAKRIFRRTDLREVLGSGSRMSFGQLVQNRVGLGRIELPPHPPHGRTLPLCYSPTLIFTTTPTRLHPVCLVLRKRGGTCRTDLRQWRKYSEKYSRFLMITKSSFGDRPVPSCLVRSGEKVNLHPKNDCSMVTVICE
jgi:hypothetical protein